MKADRRAQSARPQGGGWGMSLANSLREAKGHACPPFLRSYERCYKNAAISTEGRNLVLREPPYYIFLLPNKNDNAMYVGVTNDPERRVHEHKMKMVQGFTRKYNSNKLVLFEETHDVRAAIAREKEIKKWRREKKNNLVAAVNPKWKNLSDGWVWISPIGRADN